jgi:hypothetical protein
MATADASSRPSQDHPDAKQPEHRSPKPRKPSDAKAGEQFIQRRLASKRLTGEFCAVTTGEASDAMQACRTLLEYGLPRWREEHDRVAELSVVESGPDMLPSSEDVLEKYRQLLMLRTARKLKQIEIDRIVVEEEQLVTAIKLAVGTAKGIQGVATWETGNSRRAFNADGAISTSAARESYTPAG